MKKKIVNTYMFHPTPQSPVYRNRVTAVESPGNKSSISSSDKDDDPLQKFLKRDYKWSSTQEIDSFTIHKGLFETIRLISSRKEDSVWILDFRLKYYSKFMIMRQRQWSDTISTLESISRKFATTRSPKKKPTLNSLAEADVSFEDELVE
ncbi:non-intrinsic ABC protein [Striga asiatica]|uniref:Non-intrinsic ABC protein n=1 Tax=Striga asiatica TaxID=4170 RepID=A0A5A7PY78_STRAF|nr:non-intrinsic ABC protein [Striga asiatica]